MQALRELLAQALAQESSAADAPHGELLELALSARGPARRRPAAAGALSPGHHQRALPSAWQAQ